MSTHDTVNSYRVVSHIVTSFPFSKLESLLDRGDS